MEASSSEGLDRFDGALRGGLSSRFPLCRRAGAIGIHDAELGELRNRCLCDLGVFSGDLNADALVAKGFSRDSLAMTEPISVSLSKSPF